MGSGSTYTPCNSSVCVCVLKLMGGHAQRWPLGDCSTVVETASANSALYASGHLTSALFLLTLQQVAWQVDMLRVRTDKVKRILLLTPLHPDKPSWTSGWQAGADRTAELSYTHTTHAHLTGWTSSSIEPHGSMMCFPGSNTSGIAAPTFLSSVWPALQRRISYTMFKVP